MATLTLLPLGYCWAVYKRVRDGWGHTSCFTAPLVALPLLSSAWVAASNIFPCPEKYLEGAKHRCMPFPDPPMRTFKVALALEHSPGQVGGSGQESSEEACVGPTAGGAQGTV